MADTEKSPHEYAAYTHEPASSHNSGQEALVLPNRWMYKKLKLGKKEIWYASPNAQLILVSFVCFLCPGMFNALSGVGGGGQVDPKAANNANTALYSTFAVVGFFAGSITNRLGVKTALSIGGLGYCLYVASFLCYNFTHNEGFVIFAGAMLGVCAGLLWCGQGAIMMSYPGENSKGRFISWFWIIFNMGAVIGSLIPLGQNAHATTDVTVSNGTYIAFLVLTFCGGALAWCLVDSRDVIRKDGSKIIMMKNPSWMSEFLGLFYTFKVDPWIIALFPMFFSSNWFYTYQFNDVNSAYFSTRTKALNNVLYWTCQIFGAFLFGYSLDAQYFTRPIRARIAWIVLFCMTMGIWGGGLAFQNRYTRASVKEPGFVPMDWSSEGYVGPMFLYMAYGFYDASWQTCIYWFMGAMTNNGRKLANFAGFYKGIQSAGSAIVWSLDNKKIPFFNMLSSCWGILIGSLVFALPLVLLKIKDHVTLEEDLQFTDETAADVNPAERHD